MSTWEEAVAMATLLEQSGHGSREKGNVRRTNGRHMKEQRRAWDAGSDVERGGERKEWKVMKRWKKMWGEKWMKWGDTRLKNIGVGVTRKKMREGESGKEKKSNQQGKGPSWAQTRIDTLWQEPAQSWQGYRAVHRPMQVLETFGPGPCAVKKQHKRCKPNCIFCTYFVCARERVRQLPASGGRKGWRYDRSAQVDKKLQSRPFR